MELVPESKRKILSRLLAVLAGAGFVALVPSVTLSWVEGLYFLAAADVAAFLCFSVIAFLPRTGYDLKLWTMVFVCHFLGVVVLFQTGAQGAGYVWLIAGNVLSAVFGRTRITVASFAFSCAILAVYGIALSLGMDGRGYTPILVVITGTNLFAVCLALAIVTHMIIRGLEEAYQSRKLLADRLKKELAESRDIRKRLSRALSVKESLVQELNHRVSNNMQIVLSLMDLDSCGGEEDSVIRRHVRTLSAANELILTHENESGAEFADIVRAAAETTIPGSEACMHPNSDGRSHFFPPQFSVIAALCVSDLLAQAAPLVPQDCTIGIDGNEISLTVLFPPETSMKTVAEKVRRLGEGPMAAAAGGSVRFDAVREERNGLPGMAAILAAP